MQTDHVLPTALHELPFPAIQPDGWYRKQLQVQADGFTGHLEEIWSDVGPNSGWLGGTGESWERGPYYLDGLVPLAHLLRDQALIQKAQKWIEWMLASQRADGFFGPPANLDWWPRMVALKVLMQCHDATGDARILAFMDKYFRYQMKSLPTMPLQMWATARAGENMLSVLWLYDKISEPYLLELAERLASQSVDWNAFFNDLPYKQPMSVLFPWKEFQAFIGNHHWEELLHSTRFDPQLVQELLVKYHRSHGVNIAMALKYPALDYVRTADVRYLDMLKNGISGLEAYHGQFNGMYSCDEHLNGRAPTQGTELCTVVEAMYSYQQILLITGEAEWADRLEFLAYNALPAANTADFCAHQYDQQVNQVECSVAARDWYNNTDTSNIFGFEPHFGCCTANLHQGWPKLAKAAFAKKGETELAALVYLPMTLHTTLSGHFVTIREATNYPFADTITFTLTLHESAAFAFTFRIPVWATAPRLSINGQPTTAVEIVNNFATLKRTWQNQDVVTLTLPMNTQIIQADGYVGIRRGALLYALPIIGDWKNIKDRGRFSDWEVYPQSAWNYGICVPESGKLDIAVTEHADHQAFTGAEPPVELHLSARRVLNWDMERHSAGAIPANMQLGEPETITLIPYGCAKLRIAAFPNISHQRM